MYNMFNFLQKIAFTRVSGSLEELKCAEMIKEEIEKIGVAAKIIPFDVTKFVSSEVLLSVDGVNIQATAYNNTFDVDLDGEFYYNETNLETDLDKLENKVVLVNSLDAETYKKLLKGKAKAFITFSGDILDTDDNSDLFTREVRSHLEGLGLLPGVNIRAIDALNIVKNKAKMVQMSYKQTKEVVKSHNVFAKILGCNENEEIIYTAHYDSVDFSKGVYDNGAGSVLILKMLEYFKQNKPKRTVSFLFCGSEERGLLGSKAFINDSTEESRKKLVLNINVDVAGSILGQEYLTVLATNEATAYFDLSLKESGYPVNVKSGIYSSDSIPFSDAGIPSINLMRFGAPGTAHIHSRHDTMSFLSEESLDKTYEILEFLSKKLVNSACFPIKKAISDDIKQKIDKYLYKDLKKDEK